MRNTSASRDELHQDLVAPGRVESQADAALPPVGVFHNGVERTDGCADRAQAQSSLGIPGDCVLNLDYIGSPFS